VCIVTHDDGAWLAEALASVAAQTFRDFELVVVDDASTDGTPELLRRQAPAGAVVVRNARNLGEARSTNRACALARGTFVKVLHGDDVLEPDCLERMLPVAERPGVGLVFSRRHVLKEAGDAEADAWSRRYGELHEPLMPLGEVTPGREVLRRAVGLGLLRNVLAEPSGLMIRREALQRLGGLHLHMVGHLDVDLQLRIATAYDVGFVDARLFGYRRHGASASSRRVARELHFLDTAWSLEGLRRLPGAWEAEPRLARLHLRELRRVVRSMPAQVRLGPAGWKLRRLGRFATASLAARAGLGRPLHGLIPPPGGPDGGA
jgi:GT2 family glycosyltransferase